MPYLGRSNPGLMKTEQKLPLWSLRQWNCALTQGDESRKRRLAGEPNADDRIPFLVGIDDFLFEKWQHKRKNAVSQKAILDARGWSKDPTV